MLQTLKNCLDSYGGLYRLVLAAICNPLFLTCSAISDSKTGVQTVRGDLFAENFTYYKLSGEGWLRLELHSLKGDVDLYVSDTTLHPSFERYELKSESCGVDIIDVHSDMGRPIGIGIYSHPFYLQSSYLLDIRVISEVELDEYEQLFRMYHYYDDDYTEDRQIEDVKGKGRSNRNSHARDSPQEEEESIWWEILMTFLKFVLEIIV